MNSDRYYFEVLRVTHDTLIPIFVTNQCKAVLNDILYYFGRFFTHPLPLPRGIAA